MHGCLGYGGEELIHISRGHRLDTPGVLQHVMTRGLDYSGSYSLVRAGVAYLWIEWLGHSGAPAARAVGIRPEGVYRVEERGRQQAKYWQQVLGR